MSQNFVSLILYFNALICVEYMELDTKKRTNF